MKRKRTDDNGRRIGTKGEICVGEEEENIIRNISKDKVVNAKEQCPLEVI